MHRRDFLHQGAVASGLAALPASSWAALSGANDDLNIGVIGCGPRGIQIGRVFRRGGPQAGVRVTRVCDVFRPRLAEAQEALGIPDAGATMDYHELLADESIDAVVIATPDHWHARMSIDAMEAGKHVLVETPLSHTIEQAIAVRDAVERTGKVFAVAAQRCSQDPYWALRRALAEQRIGPVKWSQAGYGVNGRVPIFGLRNDRRISLDPNNDQYVWWHRWLGVEEGLAERIPLEPDRFFRYQKYFDYSNGLSGELLFGQLAPLLLALAGPKGEQPNRVVCGGGNYTHFDRRETPDQLMAVIDFPREHTVTLVASSVNDAMYDVKVRGRHGTATLTPDGCRLDEQPGFYPEFRSGNKDKVDAGMSRDARGRWIPDPPGGEVGYSIPSEERPNVLGNFLSSVRGEAEPDCNIDLAFAAMVGARLVSEALRTNKVMFWDAQRQEARSS